MMKTSLMERILTLREKTNQKYEAILENVMRGDYKAKQTVPSGLSGHEEAQLELTRLQSLLEKQKATNSQPNRVLRLIRSSSQVTE